MTPDQSILECIPLEGSKKISYTVVSCKTDGDLLFVVITG